MEMFESSSIFVPVIWCNNAISILNLLLIWKEMHFTCDRYNSWAETKRLEFYLGHSINKAPYIINIILEAIMTSHVVNLLHLYITIFQIIHEHNDTSTKVGTSLTILSQQKPGSCICSNSQTKTSIFSLLQKQ